MAKKRKLSWYPTRKCWRKMVQGQRYYLPGNGSGKPTDASYAIALQQLSEALEMDEEAREAAKLGHKITQIEQTADALGIEPKEAAERLAPPTSASIPDILDKYYEYQESRYKLGEIKAKTLYDREQKTQRIKQDATNEAITESILSNLNLALRSHNYASSTLGGALRYLVSAIKWAWRNRLIDNMPRNLTDLSVTIRYSSPDPMSIEELKRIIQASKDGSNRTRLYLLLAMNCGYGYADISALKKEHYSDGRLIRPRSKTGVITNHLLWAETKKLLDKYKDRSNSELLLTNSDGKALVRSEKKCNAIHQALQRWQRRTQVAPVLADIPSYRFYNLRSSVAQAITDIKDKSVAQTFLGHAASDIADKHYLVRNYDECDNALRELEQKLF